MSAFTNIPPPKSEIVDLKTGKLNSLWYNYFYNFGINIGGTGFLLSTNNLSDVANTTSARTNIHAASENGQTSIVTLGVVTTGTWNATIIAGQYGGTGVANTGKTITLGGNLVTSGANNVTFTTSGATNVTLPTTGTLVNTAVTTLSSLVSIGTITTGTWNGTAIGTVYGGTGLTSYNQGDVLYASASNTLAALAKSTTATRYLSNTGTSNNPAWAQIDLSNGITGDLPFANLTQGSALSVLGVTGNSTADVASIAAGSDHQVLRRSGTAVAFGAVNLASSNAITGNLPVANLNSGTNASGTTFWRGDGTWATPSGTSVVAPTIQKFTSASGTYTTPTSPAPLYIRVVGIGGGGGGAGGASSANNATAGSTGGNTTFGTTLLVGNGGVGGGTGAGQGGAGGTTSLGAAIGVSITGGYGGSVPNYSSALATLQAAGGHGGSGFFGGAGAGKSAAGAGATAGSANSGAGGGGGGTSSVGVGDLGGAGGGSGGYFDGIITSPSATYSYVVGNAGSGGSAGTSGTAGAAGAAGIIIVYEYYQ